MCLSHNGLIVTAEPNTKLTKREKEVVLRLLEGGRVATIAERFGLSPRTVSNHLKSAFWKLGVHSQAELIELARSEPQRIGLEKEPSTQMGMEELEERCHQARARLVRRVEEAYIGPPALSQLRTATRAALPLDLERRQDWRDWLELRARSEANGDPVGDPQQGIESWRKVNIDRMRCLQEAGLIRNDLEPEELLSTIGALTLGAAARLVGNATEASNEKELRMIDAFIDSLDGSGRP